MSHSEYVQIKKFKCIAEDPRGLTSEFSLPRLQEDFIYITRKKSSISGNSYHTGKNIATNPKTFILISGEINFSYRLVDTDNKYTEIISAPALIEVKPKVIHSVKALTDIVMLECNSLADIQQDVFKEAV